MVKNIIGRIVWLIDNQLKDILAIAGIAAVLGVIVFTVITLWNAADGRTCADYAESLMKNVPAKCLSYWLNKR